MVWWKWAAANFLLLVILGALGSHWVEANLSVSAQGYWQTAIFYHFVHTVGLLWLGYLHLHFPPQQGLINWCASFMLLGIALFCGGLYLLSAEPFMPHGIIPVGGLLWIVAWLWLLVILFRIAKDA